MRLLHFTLVPILFLGIGLSGCQRQSAPATQSQAERAAPKNIIFMVGDGMGLTQITAGMLAKPDKLYLEQCSIVGLSKTKSSNYLITDSAAGATAFATGKKTYNGAIAVSPDSLPLATLMETASRTKMATGVVVTSQLIDATPACFYAHQKSRKMTQEIAADLLTSRMDIFMGGGKADFYRRRDGRNLINEFEIKGYVFPASLSQAARLGKEDKFGFFIGEGNPPARQQGRGDFLPQASEIAIRHLARKENGFFLLIEGSQIDWGGHANDQDYVVSEMLDFDEAVGRAIAFAQQDGNTLVIITADHETGGLAITSDSLGGEGTNLRFTTKGHSATMVPVFAFGPGAENFSGVYDNTAIFDKVMQLMHWSALSRPSE